MTNLGQAAAAGWPGLAGAGAYAAQQAAAKTTPAATEPAASGPPALPCKDCQSKELTIKGKQREIDVQREEIAKLNSEIEGLQTRLDLMIPRSAESEARSDNELIKRLQEIDRLQHRNIEAAERRVCELVAYIRGKNMTVPQEGSVIAPAPTQSMTGFI